MLADDERSMRVLVERVVSDGGYEFCSVDNGQAVFDALASENPDLLLLDVMMPGLDGFCVCNTLREQGVLIPIVILSAKGDIVDKSIGFAVGADDYLVKPFSPDELLMRIQAHLRKQDRLALMQMNSIREGALEMDLRRHRVLLRGGEIPFTPKEFQILVLLAQNKGQIVTREQLVKEVWGEEFVGETSSVAVFIRKIREKIEDDPSHPKFLKTMRNVGYVFGLE
jgi:two-component system response regulator VicR